VRWENRPIRLTVSRGPNIPSRMSADLCVTETSDDFGTNYSPEKDSPQYTISFPVNDQQDVTPTGIGQ